MVKIKPGAGGVLVGDRDGLLTRLWSVNPTHDSIRGYYGSIMYFPSSLGVLPYEPRPDIDTLCSIGLEFVQKNYRGRRPVSLRLWTFGTSTNMFVTLLLLWHDMTQYVVLSSHKYPSKNRTLSPPPNNYNWQLTYVMPLDKQNID